MAISAYNPEINFDSALSLYSAVGWTDYTDNPNQLEEALRNSSFVSIFIRRERIAGLVRCVSDGQTSCYI